MILSDLLTLLPHLLVAAAAVGAMLAIAIHRDDRITAGVALSGLSAGLAATVFTFNQAASQVTPLLIVDTFARFYIGLILAAGIVTVILSYRYIGQHSALSDEYYVVLLVAILGCMVLASSSHFASAFLGLELLSVSLYVLIAYPRSDAERIEASLKYLILAAVSVSFFLFGMALIYAASGTMYFARIVERLETAEHSAKPLFLAGVVLMTVGFGFKLGLVPFHLWVPDVYQGAPTPVSAFIATVSKGAVFALMTRFFMAIEMWKWEPVFLLFAIVAVATMFTGNLLALKQDNLKRLLGYSSIAHMGYVLVAFLAGGPLGVTAITFYFLAYFITVLGAFGVLTALSEQGEDVQRLETCRGLAFRHPYLGAILTVMMFSLAGIPLTAGFIGKFYVLGAGVRQELVWLVVVMVVNSAISLFYYLRVVLTLFADPSEDGSATPLPSGFAAGTTLGFLALLLLWIGIYPTTFVVLVESATASLR